MRFALCGKLYSTPIRVERWEKVIVPLNGMNPAWQALRILEPAGFSDKKLQTISFEINDVAVYGGAVHCKDFKGSRGEFFEKMNLLPI